jgi:16S rRNA (adenine1518-N6/adenine1519-N6)-dimethyltransferase
VTTAGDGLLGAADVRRLAEELELRPTKTLGQNFVVDANTVRRIARVSGLSADDVVIEVGPGLGSLTLALLPQAGRLVAVEIDDRLADRLAATVAQRRPDLASRLAVLKADALRSSHSDLLTAAGREPTALVANLPYNVAVPVLLHLVAELPSLRTVLVMVQSEVAERLAAAPGSRIYGAPTLKLAWWGNARLAGAVSRTVFWPVPGVDSSLVAVNRRAAPVTTPPGWTPEEHRRATFAAVEAAFAQRRKTLRTALAGWAGGAVAAEALLRAAEIDPAARGETLRIEDFARLAALRVTGAAAVPSTA